MSVVALVEAISAVDWAVADQRGVARVLADAQRVRGWLDWIEVAAARRLNELAVAEPSMFPEHVAAEAGRVSLTEAAKGFDRATTTAVIPQLEAALQRGDASAGHLDVVTRALRELNSEQTAQLADRGDALALAASQLSRDEFARTVRAEVRRIHSDDGINRLQRQRRATRLRTWADRETGMWCLHGEFDPETGLTLSNRLRAMVETMFHDRIPETCPTDPMLKQQHLQALALVTLTEGRGGRDRIDVSVLIDAQTLAGGEHEGSVIDVGLPIELPVETLRRMACCAESMTPIIVAVDGVSLALGRETRLANRAQRRALRAMYRGLRDPRLPRGVRSLSRSPSAMVPQRRPHRHRQLAATVREAPPRRPRRRLAPRVGFAPNPDHHLPRRCHHDHRSALRVGRVKPGDRAVSRAARGPDRAALWRLRSRRDHPDQAC